MASLISRRGDWTVVWTRGRAVGRVKIQAAPIGAGADDADRISEHRERENNMFGCVPRTVGWA